MSVVKNSKINISAPNLINICVDESDQEEISGRMYHCYQEEPVCFANVIELIREMEELFDRIAFPQASTKTRAFKEYDSCGTTSVVRPPKLMSQERVIDNSGKKGTFITSVKYRQNATWQGEALWKEKNLQISFMNLLDFIKQIDRSLQNDIT